MGLIFFSIFMHFKCKHVFEGKISLRCQWQTGLGVLSEAVVISSLHKTLALAVLLALQNQNSGMLHSRSSRNGKSIPVNMVSQNLFE